MTTPDTLIVGIGNTILSDDAVGIEAARALYEELLRLGRPCRYEEAALGGWRLADLLVGCEHAILVDAFRGGPGAQGTCYKVDLEASGCVHLQSSHGMGLPEGLALAALSGAQLPERLSLYGIEADLVSEFGEGIASDLAAAIPAVVNEIIAVEFFAHDSEGTIEKDKDGHHG